MFSSTATPLVTESALVLSAADGAVKGSIGGPVGIAVGAGVGFLVSGVMLHYNLKKRRQSVLQSEVNRVLKGYDEKAKSIIKCGYTTAMGHFTSFSNWKTIISKMRLSPIGNTTKRNLNKDGFLDIKRAILQERQSRAVIFAGAIGVG